MEISLATRFRLVAISNIVLVLLGSWIFITYPLPFSSIVFDFGTFLTIFGVLLLDYLLNIFLLRSLKRYITADVNMQYNAVLLSWIIISFLTRLLVAAYASYTVTANSFPILIPMLIGLSSVLFGIIYLFIRQTKIALKVKTRLLVLIGLNFFNSLFFFTPIGSQFEIQGIEVGYLIVLLISGIFKQMSLFWSSWIFFSWSFKVIEIKDTDQNLYPSQELEILEES